MRKATLTSQVVAGAVIGAVSMLATMTSEVHAAPGMEKCYGIAKSGENCCANAAGKHSPSRR